MWHLLLTLHDLSLDLVICTTPRGKSAEENKQFASDVFDLIKKLTRLNKVKHRSDHLYYLLEFPSCIKDHLPAVDDSSYCVLEPTMIHVCNWEIPPKIVRLAGSDAKHSLSGQSQDSLHSGKSLSVLSPRLIFFLLCSLILPLSTNSCLIHASDNTLQIYTQCFVCWSY